MHYIKFHIKTLKIAPTRFDPKIILRDVGDASGCGVRCLLCSERHYVTHDAHHSQTHPQQRTLTQHDMLPQHRVNIMELFRECF